MLGCFNKAAQILIAPLIFLQKQIHIIKLYKHQQNSISSFDDICRENVREVNLDTKGSPNLCIVGWLIITFLHTQSNDSEPNFSYLFSV